jgi:hypothetical protein
VVGAALRDAIARVPEVHRKPELDTELGHLARGFEDLAWRLADAGPRQRAAALEAAVGLLGSGVDLARRLSATAGYDHDAAPTLYGALAGFVGFPLPGAGGIAAEPPGEPLAARNQAPTAAGD